MNQDGFLRLQIIMQDSGSTTFDSNLAKMIALVLFNAEQQLSIHKIREELINSYDLEFTEEEITRAIEKSHIGIEKIACKKQVNKHGKLFETNDDFYMLDSKTRDKYKKKLDISFEDEVIRQFILAIDNAGYNVSAEEFKKLLHKFLYSVFNSNKETLLLFLKHEDSKEVEQPSDFSQEERILINEFLNWDNDEKDKLVFQTVSYCVEYCLLNVKKGYVSYKDIFAGKKFYLDTNVILRLAGINNEERKEVISAFIKKCQENKIDIIYTNYTYQEIKDTIHSNVEEVKKILNGHRKVDTRHWKNFTRPSTNLDFIELYDTWSKKPKSNYADYNAFEKYLMKVIDDILRSFKKEDFVGFTTSKSDEYESLCSSLTTYKSARRSYVVEKSITVDVNNYMYIQEKRKKTGGTFSDVKDYMISTDGLLCNWGKEIMPGAIPICVLPSVWYSLILKFKGRSTNDYKAFNLFLNLRFKTNDEPLDGQKEKVLYLVQNLDEPVDLKNMMLDEIHQKLEEEKPKEIIPEKIVEDAKESVIKKEANKLFENFKSTSKNAMSQENKIQMLLQMAENRADKKIRRFQKLESFYEKSLFGFGIIFICAILWALRRLDFNVALILNKQIWGYSAEGWINLLGIILPVISLCFKPLIAHIIKGNCNFESVKKKELEKLKRDL